MEMRMRSPPSSPVVLKSTSSMSLHDRFTYMLRSPQTDVNVTLPPPQASASVQNQRLAQQLAVRPSVLAALKHGSGIAPRAPGHTWTPYYERAPSPTSLKRRLGEGGVRARLGPVVRGRPRATASFWEKPRGRGRPRRGSHQNRASRSHVPGGAVHGGLIRQQQGAPRGSERATYSRRFGGAARGRGRGRTPGRRLPPTREELDQQLDDYMSMTKSHLDQQLDEYMAEVDSEELP